MNIPSVPIPSRIFEQVTTMTAGEGSVYIATRLEEVVTGFPNFDKLDPFTAAMIETSVDRDKVKQALGRVHGSQRTIRRLAHVSKHEFLGRIQSVLKRLAPSLKLLGETRGFLRRLPDPTGHYTVCLAGFPNAGKTTVLHALTGSGAEIANYEFTTKALNYGSVSVKHTPIQVVDTPGTLNRVDKMNAIEKQAVIALKHLADCIVFVFDPMRDDESQEKLFAATRKYKVPIAVYASKQDLVERLPSFAGGKTGVPLFTDRHAILTWIEPEMLRQAKIAEKEAQAAADKAKADEEKSEY